MISIQCRCGATLEQGEAEVSHDRTCDRCGAGYTCICRESLAEGAGAADFDAYLWVRTGPSNMGKSFRLGGCEPIALGRSPEAGVLLPGQFVSRSHARLVRVDFGPSRWQLEDTQSRGGTFVGGQHITAQELQHGDVLRIGEYELIYEVDSERLDPLEESEVLEIAPVVPAHIGSQLAVAVAADAPLDGRLCPSCDRPLRSHERVCVPCGIVVRTGRPLLTSQVDENGVYATAEPIIKLASILVPLTVLPIPIAADARGRHRPYTIWAIAGGTIFVSLVFFIAGLSDRGAMADLMLWPSNPTIPLGQFHWYQLITHALLHDRGSIIGFILHLGGNLLFLFVFGTRVNSLIGNVATAIAYPILAVGAGLAYLATLSPTHSVPMLGASGAINGLAGMYLVLLPAHRVYCAMWIRIGFFYFWRIYFKMKIFPIRGFWILLIYFSYDILMASIRSRDSTAHWAHIGGFLTGVSIGLGLLLSKQFNFNNGDLLSVVLGKHAWSMVGKPSRWTGRWTATPAA